MAKLLIQSGADVNDAMGTTVLGHFAERGKLDIVDVLLAAGADVNYRPKYLPSALMCACEGNKPESVRALIAAGADVNCMTESGKTALSGESGQEPCDRHRFGKDLRCQIAG